VQAAELLPAWADDEHRLTRSLVHRPDRAAGPVTRWTIERLAALRP
jgi:hypothetical protein